MLRARFEWCLNVVWDPHSPRRAVDQALGSLRHLPVMERPEFWIGIVNHEKYDLDRRRDALAALFGRHVPAGTRLNCISVNEFLGMDGWYGGDTLYPADVYSQVPLKSREKCVYMYQPELMRSRGGTKYGNNGAILLRLSRRIFPADLAAVLNGRRDDGGIRILEVYATPGPVLVGKWATDAGNWRSP